MRRMSPLAVVAVLGLLPHLPTPSAGAVVAAPISTGEVRITDHGFRMGAPQDKPDVGGDNLVWVDKRGDSFEFDDQTLGRVWYKSLSTRDERPITTTLATDDANPRVSSAGWIVWTDHTTTASPPNDDVYACQLPCTSIVQVTTDTGHQMNPAIDGTTVVWEDYRDDPSPLNGVLENADIYRTTLPPTPGTEVAVVDDSIHAGDQVAPSVSVATARGPGGGKTTITTTTAWRDSFGGAADVYVNTHVRVVKNSNGQTQGTPTSTTTLATGATGEAASLSGYQVAFSGSRLLWNEPASGCTLDCGPEVLETCAVSVGACGSVDAVDSVPASAAFGTLADLDLSGVRGVWSVVTDSGGHAYTKEFPGGALLPVDDLSTNGVAVSSRVDGDRFVWAQVPGQEDPQNTDSDIYWRDVGPEPSQPRRANSISLGRFAEHANAAAEGDLVVYRRSPVEVGTTQVSNLNQLWVTDLSSPRSHRAVTTEFASDRSRPGIVGTRVVWSQLNGGIAERDLSDPDPEAPAREMSLLGPPDADGTLSVWRCGDSELCVDDGTDVTAIDVEPHMLAGSSVSPVVRISGDVVAWHEFLFDDPQTQARLHALDLGTDVDNVLGDGPFGTHGVGDFADFDISGTTVVWANGGDTISMADTACVDGGSVCPSALTTQADHTLGQVSIDADRVAWVGAEDLDPDCCAPPDVFTTTLSDGAAHLVTEEAVSFVEAPYVDGDRIYWADGRLRGLDIFAESVSGGLPGPDTTPPSPPELTASLLGGGVELSWSNPTDDDFYRVRILRKAGSTPPSGHDDDSSAIVYEGSGTSFTDTDIVSGQHYAYAIFAFDYEPNFSSPDTACTNGAC